MDIKPWTQHYDAGVPETLTPYPSHTLLDVVADTARQRPNHLALLFKGTRMTYAALEQLSNAFAAALVAQGIKKGDRVALLLPNCPQALIGQLGVWKAGGIAAPINPFYTERELEHALQECAAETVLVLTLFYHKVKSIQSRTPVRRVIATNIKEYLPPHLRLLFTLFKESKEGHRITLQAGDLWLSNLLQQNTGAPLAETVQPDDPALLLFTGGTTGTPKAALATHQALLISGLQFQAWFRGILVPWDDIILCNMPLFHVYAQGGVLSTGLVGHQPLALVPDPRDLNDMLATIRQVQPAFIPGVPTLFISLLDHPQIISGKANLRSVKLCISGAAPLLAETKRRFEALTGGHVVEGYALTESTMAAVVTPVHSAPKPGSTGLPLPDVEIRIVDADTGQRDLNARETGEILMRAPQLMQGYWQRPTETTDALRDGWLFTGDLGYLDEEGYLFIVDRKKDIIKPSGFQVWPREVEEVIASHPAVAEVGVAGVPDAHSGEAVKAWVVLHEGQRVSGDEIRAYCRQGLAAYKVPKYVEFRTSLPKNTVGKVLRRQLAAEAAEQTRRDAFPLSPG